MTTIKELRRDFNEACALRNDILSDSYHPVLDHKNLAHLAANVAFNKLESHIQNLIDQIAKLQRKTA